MTSQREWWGLLGPGEQKSERRVRTLGLGAAVRCFNDLAVPGIGGVWYAKQLLFPIVGIEIAEGMRGIGAQVQNIPAANAVEALACWLALSGNGWQAEPRLRGATKMRGKQNLAFGEMSRKGFYVTQPMRMATVEALPVLGLVETTGSRFNEFSSNDHGDQLIELAFEGTERCHYSKSAREFLLQDWGRKPSESIGATARIAIDRALSPLRSLPEGARKLVRNFLVESGGKDAERRSNAMHWMDELRSGGSAGSDWTAKPEAISDDHWRDLHVGAQLFRTRDAAIAVLDHLERTIGERNDQRLRLSDASRNQTTRQLVSELRGRAEGFRDLGHDPSPGRQAMQFCHDCLRGDEESLRSLVMRDDHVLQLRGGDIVPGPAFVGGFETSRESSEGESLDPRGRGLDLPDCISYRIQNLFLLNLDLHGELDGWLEKNAEAAA